MEICYFPSLYVIYNPWLRPWVHIHMYLKNIKITGYKRKSHIHGKIFDVLNFQFKCPYCFEVSMFSFRSRNILLKYVVLKNQTMAIFLL